ncbi:MAG: galT, partial [Haloplasmataceae bacterium]|nr:galT [Haloplasmataceae bacterium]
MDVVNNNQTIVTILNEIIEYALHNKILEQDSIVLKDIFDTEIMNCLMPRPSEISHSFWELYHLNQKEATDYFYQLSVASNYIREDRIKKNIVWKTTTKYGEIDLTINLSKPEKDPVAIALSQNTPKKAYPKCVLCKENEGFYGNVNHPARANHRIMKLNLNEEDWYLQYSPYVYYNEHCIVLKDKHEPMKISRDTFKRLLQFISLFPHYFLGSNADLPIVGGSILDHDHYQGGNYEFAMAKAGLIQEFKINGVEAGIVNWPMSVIRLRDEKSDKLVLVAELILNKWRNYSDESVNIYAYTNYEPHNTITPIARYKNNKYELDLVLRNNLTTEKYPLGIYHPHQEHHHLKKENIGLIEVMGLAVLPARLETEMNLVKHCLLNDGDLNIIDDVKKHQEWANDIKTKYSDLNEGNIDDIIKNEIGFKFSEILEQCGVFKLNEVGLKAFVNFIDSLNEK